MASTTEVPAGFRLESDTTEVSGLEYAIEYLQGQNLDAWIEYYESKGHDPDSVITGILNAANKQGASQAPKSSIRSAMTADDATEESIAEAVAKAQEYTRTHVIGAPRQRTGGMTKKATAEAGLEIARRAEALGRAPTPEELQDWYVELYNVPAGDEA